MPKLDGLVFENVASFLANPTGQPVMSEILNLIKDEISRLEIEKLACGHHEDFVKTVISPKGPDTELLNCKSNVPCIFCSKTTHISNECKRFSHPHQFQAFLFENFLCYNCFHQGHKAFACPEPKQCSVCFDPRKHNSILCSKNFQEI